MKVLFLLVAIALPVSQLAACKSVASGAKIAASTPRQEARASQNPPTRFALLRSFSRPAIRDMNSGESADYLADVVIRPATEAPDRLRVKEINQFADMGRDAIRLDRGSAYFRVDLTGNAATIAAARHQQGSEDFVARREGGIQLDQIVILKWAYAGSRGTQFCCRVTPHESNPEVVDITVVLLDDPRFCCKESSVWISAASPVAEPSLELKELTQAWTYITLPEVTSPEDAAKKLKDAKAEKLCESDDPHLLDWVREEIRLAASLGLRPLSDPCPAPPSDR